MAYGKEKRNNHSFRRSWVSFICRIGWRSTTKRRIAVWGWEYLADTAIDGMIARPIVFFWSNRSLRLEEIKSDQVVSFGMTKSARRPSNELLVWPKIWDTSSSMVQTALSPVQRRGMWNIWPGFTGVLRIRRQFANADFSDAREVSFEYFRVVFVSILNFQIEIDDVAHRRSDFFIL